jgi:hypothetical protein
VVYTAPAPRGASLYTVAEGRRPAFLVRQGQQKRCNRPSGSIFWGLFRPCKSMFVTGQAAQTHLEGSSGRAWMMRRAGPNRGQLSVPEAPLRQTGRALWDVRAAFSDVKGRGFRHTYVRSHARGGGGKSNLTQPDRPYEGSCLVRHSPSGSVRESLLN